MNNLLKNWRTTSLGLTSIAGAIVNLVFTIKKGADDQAMWMIAITQVLSGLGLIFAGDGSSSTAAHEETKQMVADLNTKIDATATAVKTGDTSVIDKAAIVANLPKQP